MVDKTPLQSLVRPWKKGAKITRPGIYSGVPLDIYHGDLCDGPSVSHSVLWPIEGKNSPKKAFANSYLNPKRVVKVQADYYALGQAIHHLAAGEAAFAKHFVVRPAVWDSWRTNAAKEWRDQQRALRMGVLDPDDIDVIQGVADALHEHPLIEAGILQGLTEHTIVYKDAATGLWVKTRPDVIPVHSGMIVDLKTAADASAVGIMRAVADFGYHGQLALIDEALWQVGAFEATEHVLVVAEKAEPFCLNIKPQPDYVIDYGRRQMRRALDIFAGCLADGHWPGYLDDGEDGFLPDWLLKRLARQAENKSLPEANRGDRTATIKAMKAEVEEAI